MLLCLDSLTYYDGIVRVRRIESDGKDYAILLIIFYVLESNIQILAALMRAT
jgi:hypothetical protein